MVGAVVVVGGDLDEENQQSPIPTNNIKSQTPFSFFLNYIDSYLCLYTSCSQGFTQVKEKEQKRGCESKNRECFTRKDTVLEDG